MPCTQFTAIIDGAMIATHLDNNVMNNKPVLLEKAMNYITNKIKCFQRIAKEVGVG